MMYALDKVGLEVVMKSGAIFDCLSTDPPTSDFINNYERKMGHAILDAGYALRPLIGGQDMIVNKSNILDCIPCGSDEDLTKNVTKAFGSTSCTQRYRYRDVWIESRYDTVVAFAPYICSYPLPPKHSHNVCNIHTL